MPFPFLRLPDVAQFEVLSKLDLFDIFYFSLLSSKTRSIAKLSNTKVGLTWKLCYTDSYHNIILENEQEERKEFVVFVGWRRDLPAKRIHFEQEIVTVRRDDSCLRFGKEGMSIAERRRLYVKFNDYILDIFKIKHYHLYGNIFFFKDFVSKYTKKLVYLTIDDRDLRMELPNALEEFSVEELTIGEAQPYRRDRLEFTTPLKVRVLTCYALNWLTTEAFWKLDCEKLVLNFSSSFSTPFSMSAKLKPHELNQMIRRWIAGCWKNLKELKIRDNCACRENQRLITNGIENDRINENSFRVQRADGTTAIVAVMNEVFTMTIEK